MPAKKTKTLKRAMVSDVSWGRRGGQPLEQAKNGGKREALK
jgi:hypothetical protein